MGNRVRFGLPVPTRTVPRPILTYFINLNISSIPGQHFRERGESIPRRPGQADRDHLPPRPSLRLALATRLRARRGRQHHQTGSVRRKPVERIPRGTAGKAANLQPQEGVSLRVLDGGQELRLLLRGLEVLAQPDELGGGCVELLATGDIRGVAGRDSLCDVLSRQVSLLSEKVLSFARFVSSTGMFVSKNVQYMSWKASKGIKCLVKFVHLSIEVIKSDLVILCRSVNSNETLPNPVLKNKTSCVNAYSNLLILYCEVPIPELFA